MLIKLVAIVAAFILAEPWLPRPTAERYARDVYAVTQQCEAALMLVATADGESNLRRSVETCRTRGRRGELGLYQLLPDYLNDATARRICRDNRLATRLAHSRLVWLRGDRGSAEAALVGYIGKSKRAERLARGRVELYAKLRREVTCGDD